MSVIVMPCIWHGATRFGTASSRHFAYASCCLVIWTLPGEKPRTWDCCYIIFVYIYIYILLAFLSPLKQRTRGRMHQWVKRKLSYTWTYEHRFYMVFTFSKQGCKMMQANTEFESPTGCHCSVFVTFPGRRQLETLLPSALEGWNWLSHLTASRWNHWGYAATSVGKRHPNDIHYTSLLASTSQQNQSTGTYPLHVLVIFCIDVFTGLPVSGAVVLTSYTTTSSCFFSYVCGILSDCITRWCTGCRSY